MPVKAIRDSRERVGSVSHERDLLRTRAQHSGDKLTGTLPDCEPLAKVHRSVFRNVRQLRLDRRDGWSRRRRDGGVVQIDSAPCHWKERANRVVHRNLWRWGTLTSWGKRIPAKFLFESSHPRTFTGAADLYTAVF